MNNQFSIEGDLNTDTRIFRYMDFTKFIDLLHGNRIYFARVDSFDDSFEGCYPKLLYETAKRITVYSGDKPSNCGILENTQNIRESAYVSCWTLAEHENMALWKIYGAQKNSLAVETTVGFLKRELEFNSKSDNRMVFCNKRVVAIEYIDHHSMCNELAKKVSINSLAPLKVKNIAYQYEKEVRVIFDILSHTAPGRNNNIKSHFGNGFTIPVNSKNLIQKIYVSPEADLSFYNLVKEILNDYKLNNILSWSTLRYTPYEEAR